MEEVIVGTILKKFPLTKNELDLYFADEIDPAWWDTVGILPSFGYLALDFFLTFGIIIVRLPMYGILINNILTDHGLFQWPEEVIEKACEILETRLKTIPKIEDE